MDSALRYFDKALKYPVEKNTTALAYYWKGEAHYRKKEYDKAIENYKEFMTKPGAFSMQEYNNANYNLGYSYFQRKEYVDANIAFRKFTNASNNSKDKLTTKRINDAYVRIGDTYFANKDYPGAVENYGNAVALKGSDVDYAMYQQALAYGLVKQSNKKIDNLLTLVNNYPKSTYVAPAEFELGKTYFQENDNGKSLNWYQKVIDEHGNSSYVNRSMSQIGLIYYNMKEDDKALQVFDRLIRRDRKSEEAEEALTIVKKIYVGKNDIPGLEQKFKEYSASVPSSYLDSAAYTNARNAYMEGNCDLASLNYGKYISRFPDGLFIQDAFFYKAECDYKSGNLDLALGGFNYIIDKTKNNFTEQALVNASAINYKQSNFANALPQFVKLEELAENPQNSMNARIGQMRCNYKLKNYEAAIILANKVITTDKVPSEIVNEAHLIIARSAMELKNNELAFTEFQSVKNLSKGEAKSEAEYMIANIQYLKGEYKESKAGVIDLIKNGSTNPLWITKGMILLADDFMGLKDNFQAKHTLKTVVESSDYQDLVKVAQDKLNAIMELEKAASTQVAPEEPKVEFKENTTNDNDKLFSEPEKKTEPDKK